MRTDKRQHYTQTEAVTLLQRLVAVADHYSEKAARRALTELLAARVGDLTIFGPLAGCFQHAADNESVRSWTERIRSQLEQWSDLEDARRRHSPRLRVGNVVNLGPKASLMIAPGDIQLVADVEGLVWFQLACLVQAAGYDSLKRCPAHRRYSNELCGRIFVRNRRQRFCSEQCQKRTLASPKGEIE